ncbi:MAG: Flp pilus assembly protein CpaB [Fibrobacterota bacterium]
MKILSGKKKTLISAILSLLTVFLIHRHYNSELSDYRSYVNVIAARLDIERGAPLSTENFKTVKMAEAALPSYCIYPEASARIEGSVSLINLKQNQPILWNYLKSPDMDKNFSDKIPEGLRAMDIEPDNSTIIRFLTPGDHIDIISSIASGRRELSESLISDIPVLAVNNTSFSATLILSPENCLKLMRKAATGNIYFTIRNRKG